MTIAVNDVTEFESDASGVVNVEGLFVDSRSAKFTTWATLPTTSLDHTARCYVLEEVRPLPFVLPTSVTRP